MKIGILNSGGDVPGLNAVIASAVKYGTSRGHEFVGFNKGWEGLLDCDLIPLNLKSVSGISHLGGTILHSVNKGRFAGKINGGDKNKIPDEILELAKSNLEKLGIGALIVIGGDGTLSGAMQLVEKGVNIVGVPKTMDNDLNGTEQTFGFSTAVSVVVDAIDRIHTTAASHDRIFFIETMGRHAGWIGLYSGLAGGANAILLPELQFTYEKLIAFLNRRNDQGNFHSIIVVAEGVKPLAGDLSVMKNVDDKPEFRLGGISYKIMEKMDELVPGRFEMRNVVLGHTQRGGSPNAEDRILSKTYGSSAIDAIEQGKFGEMVCLKDAKISTVPIMEAVGKLKLVTVDNQVYQTARKTGIYFGD